MPTHPQIPGLTDWRPLARGGFATVWEARQESLDRLVAVKVDQRTLEEEAEQRRFLREAGAAGLMSGYPGIVTVHFAGILHDDRPYIVMELCPGGSLSRWLKQDPRPTEDQVREVGVRIADALSAAHARGVLHRDVKPANILIDAYGHAGLADFGLAALPDPDADFSYAFEALTPAYAPPEMFEQQPPSEFGDVYSLAATLYALLSGRAPYGTGESKPTVASVLELQEHPVERIPGVSEGLMDLLLWALDHDPTRRPAAAELRDRLRDLSVPTAIAEPEPAGGPAVLAPEESRPAPVRSRRWLPVAAAALTVAVLGSLLVWSPWSGEVAAVPPPASPSGVPPNGVPPSPVATPATPTPSATPTPATVPATFMDCSATFGTGVYCPTTAECWGGVASLVDSPYRATPASCTGNHVYQTFLAGPLDYEPRLQSQLDADRTVKTTCTAARANSLLAAGDRRDNWEVIAIPPQGVQADDNVFRCIVGRGETSRPLTIKRPG